MSLDANQSSEQGDAMDQEELDRFEDQIKGMSLDDKVNEILKTVRAQQVKNVLDVRALQTENRELQLQQSNGMVARLASRVTATSEAGVRFPGLPQVVKLVVACRWSAVYNTEP